MLTGLSAVFEEMVYGKYLAYSIWHKIHGENGRGTIFKGQQLLYKSYSSQKGIGTYQCKNCHSGIKYLGF